MVCPSFSRPALGRSLGTGRYSSRLPHTDGRAVEAEGWLVAIQQTLGKSGHRQGARHPTESSKGGKATSSQKALCYPFRKTRCPLSNKPFLLRQILRTPHGHRPTKLVTHGQQRKLRARGGENAC